MGGEQTVLLLGAASCSQGNVSDQKPGLLNSRVHKAGPSGPGTGLRSPRLQVPASLRLPHSAAHLGRESYSAWAPLTG